MKILLSYAQLRGMPRTKKKATAKRRDPMREPGPRATIATPATLQDLHAKATELADSVDRLLRKWRELPDNLKIDHAWADGGMNSVKLLGLMKVWIARVEANFDYQRDAGSKAAKK